jgi:thiamine-monophosphate kinase
MSYDEQTVIEKFFRHLGAVRTDVALGIGDDAALLRAQPGCELVQTIDVLVEDVHFLADSTARSLGHRALAVNLSDLAAMGARPYWALLSLTLPRIDVDWLGEFAAGFGILARTHEVALVGGNLSRGPLTITVQLTGQVPVGTALRRGGARADDDLWVSGTLGDASVGRSLLAKPRGEAQADWLRARFEFPTPRVALGEALRGVASACIDLSDGMLADAPRLASASGCGLSLDVDQLPVSTALRACGGGFAWQHALQGGEDYELCFSAPAAQAPTLVSLSAQLAVPLQRCGKVQSTAGLELRRGADVIQFSHSPFDHFSP